jgi:uncharacterized protein (DUF58 family)
VSVGVPALAVEPDLLAELGRRAGQTPAGAVAQRERGGGTEFLGLREYHSGDPLRAIAWKVSARRKRMLVREFADEQRLEMILVIDAGRAGGQQIGALTRLHHAVNAAARLAQRASALGDAIGLVTYAAQLQRSSQPISGSRAFRELRGALSSLRVVGEESDPMSAALAVRKLCRHRALVLWFSEVEGAAQGGALSQAAQLLLPKHLPLFVDIRDRELAAICQQPPTSWSAPYAQLAAGHALDRDERAVRELRHLGCEVVQALPENLEAQLLRRYLELRTRRRI